MKNFVPLLAITALITLPASAIQLGSENDIFEINGKSYVWYASTKKNGTSKTTLSDGGAETEVEFKFKYKVEGGHTVFGEIELESNVFSDTDDDGDISADDIVLGIKNKSWGQVAISKNNDDPVEKYVAESLEILSRFADVSEAKTTDSKNNQLQYKSPQINGFGVVLGWAQKSNASNDEDKADTSFVLTYDNEQFSGAIGTGKTGDNTKTSGISAWYKISRKLKLTFMLVEAEFDSVVAVAAASAVVEVVSLIDGSTQTRVISEVVKAKAAVPTGDTKYTGLGLSYQISKKSKVNFAVQRVNADNTTKKRTEKAISYQHKLFEGVTLYAEVARFDRANSEKDAAGIGVKFSF